MAARKKALDKPLAERVAFITGGATGIGFGIAHCKIEIMPAN